MRDVRVKVIVMAFGYQGRSYGFEDELEIPAEHVRSWVANGFVRLLTGDEEFESNGR
ncbi:MAG: hypothetical protein ACRDQU_14795 [Pseudonocardiaceae bacterium]